MHFTALLRHYGRNEKTVRRWLNEAGIKPREPGWRGTGVVRAPKPKLTHVPGRVIYGAPPRLAERKTGLEEDAAQHLRRLTFVFRCGPKGDADQRGKFWRYGNAVFTGAELIARAERHGFDPDAWRRVA
jgi:hypothetical protein